MLDFDFKIPPETPEDISKFNDFILLLCLAMLGADEARSKGEISDEEYNAFYKKCQSIIDDITDILPSRFLT